MTDSATIELSRELLRVGGARLLDEDIDRLDELGANEAARSLLSEFHAAHGGTTLREVLEDPYFATWVDECCSRSDQGALIHQLRVWLGIGVTHGRGVDDPARLVAIERAPRQYVTLLRWAEQHNVIEELHRPAEDLAGDRPELTTGLSLLEAALQPGELQCAARSFLEDKAAAARGPATRRRLWLRAQPSETLRRLSTRLREVIGAVPLSEIEGWSFVATQPVTVDVTSGLCRGLLIGVPFVEVALDLGGYEQQALEGNCALCSESCCVHVAVLAARLLDACLDQNDRLSDGLTQFASSPSWRRFLDAATRPSSPTGVIPLRFTLEVDGHSLKVGVMRDSRRGDEGSLPKQHPAKLAAPMRLMRAKSLDERDRAAVTAMARVARTRGPERVVANIEVLRALAGHGRIAHASNGARIRLVERRLHVSFLSRPDGVVPQVQLAGYSVSARSNGCVFVESPARDSIVFAALTPAIERLLQALEHFHGALPPESYAALAPWVASLREQVELTVPDAVSGQEVPPPQKLLLRLHAFEDEGCEILVGVRAFPLSPLWPPGHGDEVEHGVIGGRPVFCRRDFAKEREIEAEVLAALQLTAAEFMVDPVHTRPCAYTVHTDEQVLQVLERVAHVSKLVNIEWTEHDRRIRSVGRVQTSDLHIKLKRVGSAFRIDGSAAFDDPELSFRQLLTSAIGGKRFVKVRGRDHLEIERELVGRLHELRYAVQLTDRELRVILAGAKTLLDVFGPQVIVEDQATEDWLARLRQVPPDLRSLDGLELASVLRPYQRDGVRWLIQCSGWAGGACLADEMGLGKTIQAIAVLLLRGAAGPALVVAPTSVLANWAAELARFAPSLRTIVYRGAKRRAALSELAAGTVLLTSYDIALRDREPLAAHTFATQVIDEAQMVRNARTKRARALKAIAAEFRIALTGTPIENRLGDLWSVFELIAPGLLGSWKMFRSLVGVPLERERNSERAARLHAVIRPLFLRRTKTEVGGDLPARIDTVRRVALSMPEQTLYRTAVKRARLALRRKKAELEQHARLEDRERDTSIRLLAELTRLRQLACHARLVIDDDRIESSKLAALLQLLADILPRGHRALIFSSFTSLLALVREALDGRGISSLYLDGATPGAARGALVDRFQAGEGDVFLISLKAGGTGLNLTAADYVVHLDPWWNPAAQAQASDRAHRIGQTRPVTIVKLVAEGTIEERMLELQEHKRWLADAVLMADETPPGLAWELLEALLGQSSD